MLTQCMYTSAQYSHVLPTKAGDEVAIDMGAIPVTVAVLLSEPSVEVQDAASRLLSNLTAGSTGEAAAVEGGAVKAVLTAIKRRPVGTDIVGDSLSAWEVCWCSDSLSVWDVCWCSC